MIDVIDVITHSVHTLKSLIHMPFVYSVKNDFD